MRIVIYPGTFDPIHNGHLDIAERAATLFDKLIFAVAANAEKNPLFSPKERIEMIREAVGSDRVEVDSFQGLLVDYAAKKGSNVILRGLRALSDFEFESQLAHMNRRLGSGRQGGLDTVFMMTGEEHFYVSSSLVREISSFGGNVSDFVPHSVERRLEEKFGRHNA